eukprot:tig00000526_g1901.t1
MPKEITPASYAGLWISWGGLGAWAYCSLEAPVACAGAAAVACAAAGIDFTLPRDTGFKGLISWLSHACTPNAW